MADATQDVSALEVYTNLPSLLWTSFKVWLGTAVATTSPALTGTQSPEMVEANKAVIAEQIKKASGGRDVSGDIARSNAEQDALHKSETSMLDSVTAGWRDFLPSLPSLDLPAGGNPLSVFFKSLDETQRVVLFVGVVVVVVLIVVAASD